jgi:hypothetical protein
MAREDVVTVAVRNRDAGIYAFQAPNPVPADLVQASFTIDIDIDDKLATGKTLAWGFEFSNDNGQNWTLGNQGTWQSYGPGGFTFTDLNGNVIVNPNPEIRLGLATRAGQLFRGTLTLNDAFRLGLVIAIT